MWKHLLYAGAVAFALIGAIAAAVLPPVTDAYPAEYFYRGVVLMLWFVGLYVGVAAIRLAFHGDEAERITLPRIFEIVFRPLGDLREEVEDAREQIRKLGEQLAEMGGRLKEQRRETRRLRKKLRRTEGDNEKGERLVRTLRDQLEDVQKEAGERIAELAAENAELRRQQRLDAGEGRG